METAKNRRFLLLFETLTALPMTQQILRITWTCLRLESCEVRMSPGLQFLTTDKTASTVTRRRVSQMPG